MSEAFERTANLPGKGRAIAVTGGNRGIGAGIVGELARRGFTVGCLSRGGGLPEGASLGGASSARASSGGAVMPFVCDVTDEDSIKAAIIGFAEAAGGLHGIVNNAGLFKEEKSEALSLATFEAVMTTNATSVMLVSREAFPHMVAAGGGGIVNIGSFWDKLGVSRNVSYCASKAAIAAITRCHAVEWARHGISAINVAPGYIETDMNAEHFASESTREWLRQRAPLGRPGKISDVAKLVAALFCEDIPFMTGETIYIDGAQSITQ
ncbi:MAG: SDR family NAD(P)-dependent oxidoreductase [Alphaproteobacteria bacterium]|jgi:NAD(P)-dependent dehydrogenase (short-subunit alcohol dehydrogenase family)